jgi:hypothetical protein
MLLAIINPRNPIRRIPNMLSKLAHGRGTISVKQS